MINCSVCILTYNSEKTIERCLASVRDFSDIVILDGGSTDKTLEIANKYNARVFPQKEVESGPIPDFTAVREKLFSLAKEDWRLWLDSDEWPDEEAIKFISNAVKKNNFECLYFFSRKAVIGGRAIVYAYFYPEYCKRLFNKNSDVSLKKNKKVHEDLVFAGNTKIEKADGAIFHSWNEKYSELIKKDNYYLNLAFRGKVILPFCKKIWIAAINILKAVKVILKSLWIYLRYGFKNTLPINFSWRFARYHFLYAKNVLFFMPLIPSIKELRLICKKADEPADWKLISWGERAIRPFTIYLTWFMIHFSITPNQITLLGTVISIFGFSLFLFGNFQANIAGLFIIYFSYLLDGVDGEVARYRRYKNIEVNNNYEFGGFYVEPISHDIQYGFLFLPIGIGSALQSGSLFPVIAAFFAAISKLLFRLAECRYGIFEKHVLEYKKADVGIAPHKVVPRATIFYFIYRNFFTSQITVYVLAIATILRHIEWFLYFYAAGFFILWAYKILKQRKRISELIERQL